MPDDGMRHVLLFEVGDLFLGQFHRQSANGIFQMRDLRRPDNRCRHRLLLEQPGERNMDARDPMLFRDSATRVTT